MSTELIQLIAIIDDLSTVVSDIRRRQMHLPVGERVCAEVQPIQDKLLKLKNQLIIDENKDIISRYCNSRIQF